jgi:RNA polymerase sigma factor (TIGR02999 family)
MSDPDSMTLSHARTASELLSRVADAPAASDALIVQLYDELRSLARAQLRGASPDTSLQATGLVHEAYLRLTSGEELREWNGPGHFFGAASLAMRRVLVDRCRRRSRQKRGGEHRRVDLDMNGFTLTTSPDELLSVDEALTVLEGHDARKAAVFELRFFMGLSVEEIAAALEISTPTVKREWRLARAILRTFVEDSSSDASD